MKILVFKIGAIGDVLLTTRAIEKIKKTFPDCQIHYFVGKRAAPILENNPFIDKIIIFEELYPHLPRSLKIIAMKNHYKKIFFNETYDYFIDFESSYYSAYISFYIKAKQKIGFKILDKRRYFLNFVYNKRIDYREENLYVANRYLYLASLLGFKFEKINAPPILKLTEEEIKFGENFLKENKIRDNDLKIMLCPSGTWVTKRWKKEYWFELINLINKNLKNAKIIILWGPDDKNFVSDMPGILIPETNLRQLASIIYFGDIIVSNDSGVRHIANALNKKTIGLFGPTNEHGWAYQDKNNIVLTSAVPCRPCDKTKCNNVKCMDEILPDTVFKSIQSIINS